MLHHKLTQLLAQTELQLSATQIEQLLQYVELLHKWNRAYNLTSVREPEQMLIRHIMDSLAVMPYLQGKEFVDVGTGPGLPGMVLAIAKPDCHFTLIDSLGKRVRFLKQVIFDLQLPNVTALQCRVEEFDEQQFDGVISRAFASLQDMLNWCQHLVNTQGKFYALKGTYPADELAALPANYKLEALHQLAVPELDADRHLLIIAKSV